VVTTLAGAISVCSLGTTSRTSALATKPGTLRVNLAISELFDLRGVAFAAWTLVAFAIGALAGVLIRRVVPAIMVTLVAYAGLAITTGVWLQDHYLAPLVTKSLSVPSTAWM